MGSIVKYEKYRYRKDHKYTKDFSMCRKLIVDIRKRTNRLEDMAERAQEVLNYFEIDEYKGEIPIVEILMKFGFKIFQSDLKPDGLSAYIAVDPKFADRFETNKITCVHIDDNIGHKRFALAHELAHYLFDFNEDEQIYYYNTYFPQKEKDSFEEQRANQFAANLLMPEKIFREKLEEYEKLNGKADTVNALGRYFSVSPTAVIRRLNELQIAGYDS